MLILATMTAGQKLLFWMTLLLIVHAIRKAHTEKKEPVNQRGMKEIAKEAALKGSISLGFAILKGMCGHKHR